MGCTFPEEKKPMLEGVLRSLNPDGQAAWRSLHDSLLASELVTEARITHNDNSRGLGTTLLAGGKAVLRCHFKNGYAFVQYVVGQGGLPAQQYPTLTQLPKSSWREGQDARRLERLSLDTLPVALEAARECLVLYTGEVVTLPGNGASSSIPAGSTQPEVLQAGSAAPEKTGVRSPHLLPEEITEAAQYKEGVAQQVLVNRYERNPKARQACLDHYGPVCVICRFEGEDAYGEIGAGVIHVHHVVPLSAVGEGYKCDPITDLRPVCPNCHAVLHRSDPPWSIDGLAARIRS